MTKVNLISMIKHWEIKKLISVQIETKNISILEVIIFYPHVIV